MRKTLYLAYGSNLNLEQMAKRCPTANPFKVGMVHNFKLVFRGRERTAVATIEACENKTVPVLIWEIEESDEKALDVYEGFPWLYRKEMVEVQVEGETLDVMAYIMNPGREISSPSIGYYNTILAGYKDNRLDVAILEKALIECSNMKG